MGVQEDLGPPGEVARVQEILQFYFGDREKLSHNSLRQIGSS